MSQLSIDNSRSGEGRILLTSGNLRSKSEIWMTSRMDERCRRRRTLMRTYWIASRNSTMLTTKSLGRYIFIVCATGKSSSEMLRILESRINNSSEDELLVAASEQSKISKLRLEKLVHE
ncbi:hypothetical protein PsorP6_004619 [Peronosclerospora sorghi]|uniref:Uncharacterized protein n=1 Tax=Peronosclerospora sorghi TaxID=230839 RepID=A0ACC0VKI8_9STRA|nr:hypothetical protein PsorP6_004619 [Peronosclerospora sorghi]